MSGRDPLPCDTWQVRESEHVAQVLQLARDTQLAQPTMWDGFLHPVGWKIKLKDPIGVQEVVIL